ncbi:hypothetical protein [Spirillospora albida]|uniref:hypothetical protein n=1 Tax=Spirillospora albida TaxID=58123 RepID=UPI00068F14DD|nr:hypothetical protein [Spirillospora albida]
MIRRFVAGTALATGLVLTTAGCLGDAGNKVNEAGENIQLTAAQVLGKAAEKTGSIDSFKAAFSMKMAGGAQQVTASGDMQYRLKPELAFSMKMDAMEAAGKSMGGMEQRLIGQTMYMKMPMLSQLGGGSAKPWMKFSLEELSKQSGVNLTEMMQQSQQMDPVQNTKMLTASKDVREVGKETIDGVQTTHYAGTYNMQDALAKLPAEQQEAARKSFAQSGMSSMTFDLWVDGQQLPRKMTMQSNKTAQGTMSMSMTYRDYGKPVEIVAPPADQVGDFGAMMKNLGGGGVPRA